MSISFKSSGVACAVFTTLLLMGCWGKTPTQLLESSKAALQKQEFNAATIQLKNVLQAEPNNAEARFLLGKALLDTGRPAEALIELTKARELQYPEASLAAPMGMAMVAQGEADRFIAEFGKVEIADPKLRAELLAALSTAYGVQRKLELSREAAEAALKADPNNLNANLLVAQLLRMDGKNAEALAQIEETIKRLPKAGEPWLAKAEHLLAVQRDSQGSLSAYRQAQRLLPKTNPLPYIGITQELIRQRAFDEAKAQLDELEKVQPRSVQGRYLATLLAYERRDFKAAFEASQELLRQAPDDPRHLHLAGAIEYERGNYLQASMHLGKALSGTASPVPVRVLLARSLWRAGDGRKGLAYLQPLIDSDQPAPAEVYSIAADIHSSLGNRQAAAKLYARVVEIQPSDERGRTMVALSTLEAGRDEQALAQLNAIASDAKGINAEIGLLAAHIKAKRFDDAVKVVSSIERKMPGQALAPFFHARIEQLRGDSGKARGLYEAALGRDAGFTPAVSALALLDFEERKPTSAVARYEKLVAVIPKDVGARLGLIAARQRAGAAPDEVLKQLEEATRLFPDAEVVRVTYAGRLLDRRDAKTALKAALDGLARFPDSVGLLEAQGLAELAQNNLSQAAQAFTKAASLKPDAIGPQMYLAEVHLARKDLPAALAQLHKAVALKPDYMPAQVRLVSLLANLNRHDQAQSAAKAVQTKFPDDPTGWAMEADLLRLKGNRAGAVSALKTAFAKRPSDDLMIKLHNALREANLSSDARVLAQSWLAKNPDASTVHLYLGDVAITEGQCEPAHKHLSRAVALEPRNAAAMNNLAWSMFHCKKPGAAEIGEKALALTPDSDAIMDTLAEIYAGTGHDDKALALQKRAVERNPNMPVLRLHLARYLIKNDQKAEARLELERLASLGSGFSGQGEVGKLMASLGPK